MTSDPTAPPPPPARQPWESAWRGAQLADDGFYRRPDGHPGAHFRTSSQIGGPFAAAIAELVLAVDDRLGRPDPLDVVDVGAGGGELLIAVLGMLELARPELLARVRLAGVDLRERPAEISRQIGWLPGEAADAVPDPVHGLLLACELLDDIPAEIVTADHDGRWRQVLVDAAGGESCGSAVSAATAHWLAHYRPSPRPGDRAEVGSRRDELCAALLGRLTAGTAVFVDYPVPVTAATGTLTGFRDGRQVAPVPDGSMNLTAHVTMTSCQQTAEQFGQTELTGQQAVLAPLARRPAWLAAAGVLADLQWRSDFGELTDRSGLGGHQWLRCDVDPGRGGRG